MGHCVEVTWSLTFARWRHQLSPASRTHYAVCDDIVTIAIQRGAFWFINVMHNKTKIPISWFTNVPGIHTQYIGPYFLLDIRLDLFSFLYDL